ncbi:MAG: hypothetical protein B6D39_08945 [Anaerolineae bacterium UTCFX2]|jgi:hypothetical protein|nr:S26 family signal peptidase [Anaerolineae bacterium]MCZ7552080.1 S26 family signal peptidase [Anaerolineales bacterium]OQY89894.1 MAG: hypothetical protein B6D39_08945 [Anaerolineae bacterium UTCFX2]
MPSSLTESDLIPSWAEQRGLTRCFVYNGPSMRPTFAPGQLLYVRPLTADLQPGDVLVFQDPGSAERFVVHRALALTHDGWLMRGDNNRLQDAAPVPLSRIVGRVELAEAGGDYRPVRGGRFGLWRAALRWGLYQPLQAFRLVFGWLYRALRGWSPLRRWLKLRFGGGLQTVRLETPQGPLVKTLWRGRPVARWQPHTGRFECRKPFDMFVDKPDVREKEGNRADTEVAEIPQ